MANNFMDEYFKGFNDLEEGQDVTGVVTLIKDDYIILDLASAIEGKMYINEFTTTKNAKFSDYVSLGDKVSGRIMKITDEGTSIAYLSRKHIIEKENFESVKEAFINHQNIVAKVVKVVNKGVVMEYNHVEIFMHESQAATTDLASLVGQSLEVEITTVDDKTKRISASRSQVIYKEEKARRDQERKELEAKKQAELATLTVGTRVEMTVTQVSDRYAVLQAKYNQAVLPLSNLDHHHYEKVSDVLKEGDKLEVEVVQNEVVNGKQKIAVSRKALLKTPYEIFKEANPVGTVLETTIIRKLAFGVICALATDVTGLLHMNEISYNPNDNTFASLVHGNKIAVKVISYNDKDEKIGLSIKQLGENPWASVTVSKGQIVNATVKEISPKGVTCVVQGVDAYLPTSEVANVEKVTRAEDYLNVGDEVKAKVVDVNEARWYIKLSIKEMIQDEERKQFDEYYKSQEETVVTLGDLFGEKLKKFNK